MVVPNVAAELRALAADRTDFHWTNVSFAIQPEQYITYPAEMTKDPQTSIVPLLRQPAYLAPQDSLIRAVETLRFSGMDLLPVVGPAGELSGVFDMRCLRPLLGRDDRDTRMAEPLARWMRRPEAVGRADMDREDALGLLTAGGDTALFVVDRDGRYAGAITMADILSPTPIPVRPPHIGGMATPWGVYLTNGSIQAGAGNAALVGSGMLMGAILTLSDRVVPLFCWAAQRWLGWPLMDLYNSSPPATVNLLWVVSLLLHGGLTLPVFLIIMRLLPLAGYHAAEHQAVHAMERGEMLIPDVVKRMPRVHPRCGTNLMAGLLVFVGVSQSLPAMRIGLEAPESALLGALATLFTWRSLGSFLQQHFTTRPATDKQIASGIAAAEDLQRKFLLTEPRRARFFQRLWCMGFVQMMLGTSIAFSLVTLLAWAASLYGILPG
jgi:CBS domain-containing protein